ncbi:MAG: DUF2752 domain-containing protein [Phycisphaerales bacterium]|nr:DUF2752 domain-containing protein [Phycisphaerales bacterium]
MEKSRPNSTNLTESGNAELCAEAPGGQLVVEQAQRMDAVGARRLWGLTLAILAGTLLGIAVSLSPDPDGYGTHAQLGLPACSWMSGFGIPCPTCGMTTSFSHAVKGELGHAFMAQPLGAILAVVTAAILLLGVYVAITGSRVANRLAGPFRARWLWTISAVVLVAWGYKILVVTTGASS